MLAAVSSMWKLMQMTQMDVIHFARWRGIGNNHHGKGSVSKPRVLIICFCWKRPLVSLLLKLHHTPIWEWSQPFYCGMQN